MDRREIQRKAVLGLLRFEVALLVLLFVPAGTLRYPEAWLYFIVFSLCSAGLSAYFLIHDPALVGRRLTAGPTAERERDQQVIQGLAGLAAVATLVLPGIERHFHGGHYSWLVVLAGDAVVVAGYAIIFRVFQENSHAASVIQVEANQQVISSGPYGLVRHPMYSGALLMFAGTPVALGSCWAFVGTAALAAAIVARLLAEETYLARNLPGYDEYRQRVRHRLIPGVW